MPTASRRNTKNLTAAKMPPNRTTRTAKPCKQTGIPCRTINEIGGGEKERTQRRNERKRKKGILQSRVYKETFGVEKVSEFLAGMKKK